MKPYPMNFFNFNDRMWNSKNGNYKHFKIGDTEIQIENIENRYFTMADVEFKMTKDGTISVMYTGENTKYKSLDELGAAIKHYRLMYKKFQELSTQIQMEKDFV